MNTRVDEGSTAWYRNDPGVETSYRKDRSSSGSGDLGSATVNAMDAMVRWPFQMTAAGLQWMTSGMQRLGQSGSETSGQASYSGRSNASSSSDRDNSWRSWTDPAQWTGSSRGSQTETGSGGSSGIGDQDLSGPDLKYVHWSIVFTKPGYETVLEPQQDELVNYSTDGSSFAALKIAKFLEKARHGKMDKPGSWVDHSYPPEPPAAEKRRTEGSAAGRAENSGGDKGWRVPGDDQKYITFLYHVERRLPKQEAEVTRVERVTVERTSNSGGSNIV